MADYQEYRRRILHRRWRRVFIIVALLALLALLSAIGILWKVLHRERVDTALSQNTILRQVTTDNTWNTVSYPLARQLRVQTLEGSTETALDFRMAALPASAPVEKSWFAQASFVGDSLTQGLQIYDTGLPGAQFCAYKGVGPNAFVNGTSCKRVDGVTEIPLDALTAQQPKAVYVLLGSNVLGQDTDYTSFLTYYRLMLDMISQALPDAKIYVQSITPVRPEVSTRANHAGLNRDRLCHINNELAAIALEKNCYFLNLWEVLADENGDLIESYAQPDGYHIKPEGYAVWVDYLCSHTMERKYKRRCPQGQRLLCFIGLFYQNRPVILPSASTSMFTAAGFLGRPGMVMMLPQMTTTKPAPAARRTSRTSMVKPVGAPVSLALSLKLYWVLAMQTGRLP